MKFNIDKFKNLRTKHLNSSNENSEGIEPKVSNKTVSVERKGINISGRMKKITAAAVIACLLIFGISCSGNSNSSSSAESKTETIIAEPILSFTVKTESWDTANDGSLAVKISGTTSDGETVTEQYKATPDTKYQTDLKAGSYTISLASTNATKGTRIFKAEPVKFEFNEKADKTVTLEVTLDKKATETAEAEKKAADERAAAEKKAAEEKAAAEKAAAEAAAAAAVASSTSSTSASNGSASSNSGITSGGSSSGGSSGGTVYIASSGKGKKYHSYSTCSNMKGATAVSLEQAQNMGYTKCSKC